MGRIASQCCLNLLYKSDNSRGVRVGIGPYLFVNNYIDLNSSFCSPLKDLVESPFLVIVWRPSQKELRREPPILDINDLFGVLKRNG